MYGCGLFISNYSKCMHVSSVHFSSVTACSLPLEWAARLKMSPRYRPARQKFPLSLRNIHFRILSDVSFMLKSILQIKICDRATISSSPLQQINISQHPHYPVGHLFSISCLRIGLNLNALVPKVFWWCWHWNLEKGLLWIYFYCIVQMFNLM